MNPDSGIFMRTPDSHRIRTIRYGSTPPDLIGLELLMFCKGIRHLDHPRGTGNAMPCSRTNAIQVRQVPNPPSLPCLPGLPCLPLPSCGKPFPESSRPGRASISVRVGGLGVHLRMTRCRGWDFHADKPEFPDADKNLKLF